MLPDGTRVWLNAASSLKYPAGFTGKERLVELTGEGYFVVTKNKQMPFKVKFNNEEVEVLGTHFDIMAYEEEGESRTTLLEGSVKISKGPLKKILIPGDQAICPNNQNDFTIKRADTASVLAWKEGIFSLQNTSIHQIMRQIARWYDVDVIYMANAKDLEDKIYGGRVSKSNDMTEVLRNLELTGTIHFKVDGRRVMVMQ
jgi:ferric-dicitrate binding protein FerR (iron transport regulator)